MVEPRVLWGEPGRHPIRAEPRARRIAARWLLPVEAPPIERGAILVNPQGRIEAVGPEVAVPRPPDVLAEDFGDAVLLPGLINTHTHLELTGFDRRIEARDFPTWIRELRQLKATRTPAEYLDAARRGLASCYAGGVTTIADTGDSGTVTQALSEADASGVVYLEVFGPDPAQLKESLTQLQARVRSGCSAASDRVRIGVSPHAPYTVSGPLFRAVARWAREEGLPIAVHVAESAAEVQFLLAGAGPFADAWLARGIPLPSLLGRTPIAWLGEHDVLSEHTLCIHAVQVGAEDVRRIADLGAAVAHCPISNKLHGHGAAPLAALLDAEVRVGLGTDSVVSVGHLDLLAEARTAGLLASLDADDMVELCTLAGARALGLDAETGSLVEGKWADCTVIQPSRREGTAAERLLADSPTHVLLTCVGGKEVYRAP